MRVCLQILAMVRFLPSLWDTAAPLAFADLSGFGQFAAFDCLLPGPVDKLAYTRICLTAFGVPALLFATFLLGWIARWGLRRAAAALHQRTVGTNSSSAGSNAQGSTLPGGSSTSVQTVRGCVFCSAVGVWSVLEAGLLGAGEDLITDAEHMECNLGKFLAPP